jgi:acetoin utilization protein AcuB
MSFPPLTNGGSARGWSLARFSLLLIGGFVPMDYSIAGYMTQTPHTIGRSQTLAVAHELMLRHDIRHLPVLDGGKLVGILSERDLLLLETFRGIDPRTVKVEEAMMPDPFVASPSAPAGEICRLMAQHKYGSVIVAEHGKVVGIFTAIDALRILAGEASHPQAKSESRRASEAGPIHVP